MQVYIYVLFLNDLLLLSGANASVIHQNSRAFPRAQARDHSISNA